MARKMKINTKRPIESYEHLDKRQVPVHGFDYYNTKTGGIESLKVIGVESIRKENQ